MDELEQQITELRRAHRDTAIDRPRPGENAYERVDDADESETEPAPDEYKVSYDDGDLPAGEVGDDLPRKTDDDGEPTDDIDYGDIGPVGMVGPNGQGSVSLGDVEAEPTDRSDDDLPDDLPDDGGDDERGRSERGRRPRGRKPR